MSWNPAQERKKRRNERVISSQEISAYPEGDASLNKGKKMSESNHLHIEDGG